MLFDSPPETAALWRGRDERKRDVALWMLHISCFLWIEESVMRWQRRYISPVRGAKESLKCRRAELTHFRGIQTLHESFDLPEYFILFHR